MLKVAKVKIVKNDSVKEILLKTGGGRQAECDFCHSYSVCSFLQHSQQENSLTCSETLQLNFECPLIMDIIYSLKHKNN